MHPTSTRPGPPTLVGSRDLATAQGVGRELAKAIARSNGGAPELKLAKRVARLVFLEETGRVPTHARPYTLEQYRRVGAALDWLLSKHGRGSLERLIERACVM